MDTRRTEQLLKIRPQIASAKPNEFSAIESFQNKTLRPIIKFQNDLLVVVFQNYLEKRKLTSLKLSKEKMAGIINQVFLKDISFKNQIQGIIIGHFTKFEFEFYANRSSELNKRITQIIKERLLSQIAS